MESMSKAQSKQLDLDYQCNCCNRFGGYGESIGGPCSSASSVNHGRCSGKTCFCGLRAVVRVSRTPKNLEKKFYGCRWYDRPHGCDFFEWVEDDDCLSCQRKKLNLEMHKFEQDKCLSCQREKPKEEMHRFKQERCSSCQRERIKVMMQSVSWVGLVAIGLMLGLMLGSKW